MKQNNKKTKSQITVEIDDDLKAKIEKMAHTEVRKFTDQIRKILQDGVINVE